MPTYEYKCLECGHLFEEFQKMSDAPIEVCPKCGGKVKRLISNGAGLVFKGSGFYLTDYKNSNSSSVSSNNNKSKNTSTGKTSEPAKASNSKKESA